MSGRRRIILVSILVLGVLSVPALALAHPLGNFTINTSASLVLRADEVVVDYVVDMAEIPAFQERGTIDADGDGALSSDEKAGYREDTCEGLRAGMRMDIDGAPAGLVTRSSEFSLPEGQAGLPTLRLTCVLYSNVAASDAHHLVFEDSNYPDRPGWPERRDGRDRRDRTRGSDRPRRPRRSSR